MTINSPALWRESLPIPKPEGHKYDRGHCVVIGGEVLTGAARLASAAAARIGAGLVTVIATGASGAVYRMTAPAHIMVEDAGADKVAHLRDARRNALVLGPGFGGDAGALIGWLEARQAQSLVLDADGLNHAHGRFELLRAGDVLTPHAGEYKKLFGDITPQDAARASGAIIVLKGRKTTITDGTKTIINENAGPYLASAGTGDVLAGMIGGLLAQGMAPFAAACAAVWIHGEAGRQIGAGLVASDIPDALPGILQAVLPENA